MYKYKIILIILLTISYSRLFSLEIPTKTRELYSSHLYNAFILQSQGKSNIAFIQFHSAREEARKAGENPLKILTIEQLFYWYRKYGSSLNLFYKNPVGHDKIIDEYQTLYLSSNSRPARETYKSEWGKTPEDAARIREFMFGIGETISGIFIAVVQPGLGSGIGIVLWADGFTRIFTSLNNIWANHEALTQLKYCQQTASQAMNAADQ